MEITLNQSFRALTGLPSGREQIERLESELLKREQAVCPVRWLFAPGIAAREMTIPAGVVLTGAVHKTEHLNIISQGCIRVETGNGVEEIHAPCAFVSKPGTKRAGLALKDTVWTTVHATTTTDPRALVEELTESKYEDMLEVRRELALTAGTTKRIE